jgi:PhzF family phenazine biosynthesis protein
MQDKIVQIDAFTDRPFRGNPAAVCLLSGPAEEGWMRAVAREMNLSETAYLHPEAEGYRLRWFTPEAEVELCGHATVASAHLLWEDGHLDPASPAVFLTRSGRLTARRKGKWIEVDFPADFEAEGAAAPDSSALEAALGAPTLSARTTGLYALVEVESEALLLSIAPDFHRLRELHPVGVCVTA